MFSSPPASLPPFPRPPQSLVESGRGKDVLLCSTSPIRDPEVEEKMKEMRVSKEKAEKENRKLKKQLQVRLNGMAHAAEFSLWRHSREIFLVYAEEPRCSATT